MANQAEVEAALRNDIHSLQIEDAYYRTNDSLLELEELLADRSEYEEMYQAVVAMKKTFEKLNPIARAL